MTSPDDMMAAVTTGLKERTGRDLDEWLEVVEASGLDPLDQKAVRQWLKTEHGVPQNSQWAIADAAARAAGWQRPTVEGYAAGQFAGEKAHLRPIYDRIVAAALEIADDVRLEGRSTYIPLVRARQFAAIAAPTKTRVDLGLRFTDPPANPRLTLAKGFAQVTHKIALSSPEEVDEEVVGLLRAAYQQNG
jgi:hypothetical protein